MPRILERLSQHRQHRTGKLSHPPIIGWVWMILEADDEGRPTRDTEHPRVVIFGYHPKVTTPI